MGTWRVAPVPMIFPNHTEGAPGPSHLGTGHIDTMRVPATIQLPESQALVIASTYRAHRLVDTHTAEVSLECHFVLMHPPVCTEIRATGGRGVWVVPLLWSEFALRPVHRGGGWVVDSHLQFSGSLTVARAPSPSSRFTSRISPPCPRAICWASARPTPLPFGLVV